jgi:hypothetical protein
MLRLRVISPACLLAFVMFGSATAPSAPPQTKTPPWEFAKAKAEAARKACLAVADEYLQGKATVEQVHQWSQRWMNSLRDINPKKSDQIAALEDHIKRMQQLEKAAQDKVEAKRGAESDVFAAEYHRLQAQLDLSKLKASR